MEWGLDFSPGRKAPPRRGRRAGISDNTSPTAFPLTPERDDIGSTYDIMDSPVSNSAHSSGFLNSPPKGLDSGAPVAPPRSRKTGGWADEAIKSGKRRSAVNLIEQERFREPDQTKGDSDDDIPIIPDLDDTQDEDMASQIAHAPSSVVNRVDTYKELNSDLFKHATFATLDDVSLRLLTNCLNLESEIEEDDTTWTWDLLFTSVASDLHYELENQTQSNLDKDVASSP
ncbi:intraflagellar transport protein 43 homolog isoform X2 [Zootermopsis nevadensis]|uniref:intraflagellar transport protein 43 homolog isoform X2 n=1 Tax=Zootermopsis nevadensis TaxID=136037 RepID=UPI000B8ED4C3|nr:intraflagellar transport protein 43 homolog isoform X2 [Zootermopsis nevadensis]